MRGPYVDVVGRELLCRARRRVEQSKGSRDERRNLPVGETKEEALVLRPGITRVIALLDVTKDLGLCLQPREAKVGRQRVHRANHVGVLQVPGVLIGHPLGVGEDGADVRSLAGDGAFVATQLLQANDVEGSQFKGHEGPKTLRDAFAVDLDELILLLCTRCLREVLT